MSPMVYLYLVTSEVEFKTEENLLLAQSTIPELKPLRPPIFPLPLSRQQMKYIRGMHYRNKIIRFIDMILQRLLFDKFRCLYNRLGLKQNE